MRHFLTLLGIGLLFNINSAFTQEESHHLHPQTLIKMNFSNSKVIIESAPSKLTVFKPATVRFQLIKNGKVLTLNSLKEKHNEKLHVMVIDSLLEDLHHIHPIEDVNNQDFVFDFIPKNKGSYQMWVEITPKETNKQELLVANLGTLLELSNLPKVKGKQILSTSRTPYVFNLEVNPKPKSGRESRAVLTVTNNKQPFIKLEPIVGSFAHFVGFSGDHSSMLQIHPLGKKPSKKTDRGGSKLEFHITFKKTGFFKLFAQVRINKQDYLVPFGIIVQS